MAIKNHPTIKTLKWLAFIFALAILVYLANAYFNKVNLPVTPEISEPLILEPLIKVDHIVVEKASRKMTLYQQGRQVRTYNIALGFSPQGHKKQSGDGKTPEGLYKISYKNPKSKFHLSLRISYPSVEDHQRAKQEGVSPGSDIMIHGLGEPFKWLGSKHVLRDWTLGCIALTNEEIAEIYPAVEVGTTIEIRP